MIVNLRKSMSENVKRVFWVAGENSGDLHSSMVLRALKKMGTEYKHIGIGGHRMQAEGFVPMFPFSKFSLIGFWEVLRSLSFIWRVEREIKKTLERIRPELVVLVDYPGLNLRLARMAYDLGIPVLYFICPQFWAWHHSRVHKLKENTNFVALILPFEKELLDIHRVTSEYVGHPIAEEIVFEVDRKQFSRTFGLDHDKKWLGFMPGSRDTEIKKILPAFIETIKLFTGDEYEFLLSKSHTVNTELFMNLIPQELRSRITIIDGYMYEMMKYSHFMVVTSGTATLETAFIGTPFIIVYKTSNISYSIAKKLIRVKKIGLPNIILEDDVVPELIQDEVKGEKIYRYMQEYLTYDSSYTKMQNELHKVAGLLSEKSASREVAAIIEKMVERK